MTEIKKYVPETLSYEDYFRTLEFRTKSECEEYETRAAELNEEVIPAFGNSALLDGRIVALSYPLEYCEKAFVVYLDDEDDLAKAALWFASEYNVCDDAYSVQSFRNNIDFPCCAIVYFNVGGYLGITDALDYYRNAQKELNVVGEMCGEYLPNYHKIVLTSADSKKTELLREVREAMQTFKESDDLSDGELLDIYHDVMVKVEATLAQDIGADAQPKQVGESFLEDGEKMHDFLRLSEDEFLQSYSYLTKADYAATITAMNDAIIEKLNQ